MLKSGNKKAKTMRFKPETVRFWNMNDAIQKRCDLEDVIFDVINHIAESQADYRDQQ